MAEKTHRASVATNDADNTSISQRALATVELPKGFEIEGFSFEVERQLTRAVMSQEDDKPYAIKITGPVMQAPSESTGRRERKRVSKKDENGKPMKGEDGKVIYEDAPEETDKQKPPMICDITNLVTGELQTLVVNASLEDELNEKFPDDGYVGKCFAFKSKLMPTKDRTRKFRLYTLYQIKEPNIGSSEKLQKAAE